MSSSFFFKHVAKGNENRFFLTELEQFSDKYKKQVYVIDRPLGDSKYHYDYEHALVLLIPNYKIIFIDFGDNAEKFREFVDDFTEDLGSISDKYRYREIIGRPREWKKNLIAEERYENSLSIKDLLNRNCLSNGEQKRACELLISLLTGSINDINKVKGGVPDNILDRVKQKILLFDGDQTRFIYQNLTQKRVTIQGLSGTGKTELLLHKLKEIYTEHESSKVIFTCHNKILADNMRRRIPDFFDFMKVEEQIKWDERLWCVNSWGSRSDRDSGAYSYICDFYDLDFLSYNPSSRTFDVVCKIALDQIKSKVDKYGFAFDYMLVDESQDLPNSFFDICELITKNAVYIAGDIFQSIFDDKIVSEITPDFLLSKCYRTDPRTLMFAHAVGMGLFETPKIRWLEDKEWAACGYIVNKAGSSRYLLSREPLRRFEDLENEGYSSINLVKTRRESGEDAETKIIEIIREIKAENPTVLCDDIGIIFIDDSKNTYATADKLEQSIPREFGWEVNKAYETKQKIDDTLFVSNKNNVKGLEFPFVICVTKVINNTRSYRNALYMMLTRSFIKTYFLISEDYNSDLSDVLDRGLKTIRDKGVLEVIAPSREERERIKTTITYGKDNVSFEDMVYQIFDELDVLPIFRKGLFEIAKKVIGDSLDYDDLRDIIDFNYKKMSNKKK